MTNLPKMDGSDFDAYHEACKGMQGYNRRAWLLVYHNLLNAGLLMNPREPKDALHEDADPIMRNASRSVRRRIAVQRAFKK